jgi:hypothetical protein
VRWCEQDIAQQLKLAKLAQQVLPITAQIDKRSTFPLSAVTLPERKVMASQCCDRRCDVGRGSLLWCWCRCSRRTSAG